MTETTEYACMQLSTLAGNVVRFGLDFRVVLRNFYCIDYVDVHSLHFEGYLNCFLNGRMYRQLNKSSTKFWSQADNFVYCRWNKLYDFGKNVYTLTSSIVVGSDVYIFMCVSGQDE